MRVLGGGKATALNEAHRPPIQFRTHILLQIADLLPPEREALPSHLNGLPLLPVRGCGGGGRRGRGDEGLGRGESDGFKRGPPSPDSVPDAHSPTNRRPSSSGKGSPPQSPQRSPSSPGVGG